MNKLYYLKTCSTCQRIMKDFDLDKFELREIKTEPISKDELKEMHDKAGSYEALFSRRSMKYKEWGLKEKQLSEVDMRDYILKEYTFLKRPVFLIDDEIFVGNAKKVVEAALNAYK